MYLLFSAFQCFFVLFCKKVKKVIPFTFFLAFATVQKSTSLFQSKFVQKAQKSSKKFKKSSKFGDVSWENSKKALKSTEKVIKSKGDVL